MEIMLMKPHGTIVSVSIFLIFIRRTLKKERNFTLKEDYTDKEGNKRYSTDVVVEKVIPLESTGGSGNSNYDNSSGGGSVNEPDVQVENNDDLPF